LWWMHLFAHVLEIPWLVHFITNIIKTGCPYVLYMSLHYMQQIMELKYFICICQLHLVISYQIQNILVRRNSRAIMYIVAVSNDDFLSLGQDLIASLSLSATTKNPTIYLYIMDTIIFILVLRVLIYKDFS